MSVSNGLVGNIVLPTRLFPTAVDGLLPSAILIYDGFLCCCDELWPSLIAIFFAVISGTVPANIGLNLPNLQSFYFVGNEFSGPIPTSFCNAT